MRLLCVIDNYDSFTYNLVQMFLIEGHQIEVYRNDAVDIKVLGRMKFSGFVISPGPGRPEDSGVSLDVVKLAYQRKIPLLGVCLGHQVIARFFNGVVGRGDYPVHGKKDLIYHNGMGIYNNIPNPFEAARYHSLIVEKESLPPELRITAWNSEGVIMGIEHLEAPIFGLQFHPESFLTQEGQKIIANFLAVCGDEKRVHSISD